MGIDDNDNDKSNSQVENTGNVDVTRFDSDNHVSTYSITENLSNNFLKDRYEDIELVPDYIDQNFAHQYACYFGGDVKKIDEL